MLNSDFCLNLAAYYVTPERWRSRRRLPSSDAGITNGGRSSTYERDSDDDGDYHHIVTGDRGRPPREYDLSVEGIDQQVTQREKRRDRNEHPSEADEVSVPALQ